jgi:hypothetical protein
MTYQNKGALKMTEDMEMRPRAAKGVRGNNAADSTKGDVGMSPRISQGPGNHGSFAKNIAGRNGVSFKGDPMHNYPGSKDVGGSGRGERY